MNPSYRKTMEDAFVFVDSYAGDEKQGFFAVYDGHGGREAADMVSARLHKHLEEALKASDPADALEIAVHATDQDLKNNNVMFSGTTAAMAFLTRHTTVEHQRMDAPAPGPKGMLYVANVGDTRCVLCRSRKAMRLTRDHKACLPDEMKRIKEAGGFVALGRVNGILGVSRALGDHCLKEFVVCDPYLYQHPLDEEDEFLIIACDGVWDVMEDSEAVDIVRESLMQDSSPQKAANELKDAALKKRSPDNITVLLLLL